MTLEPINTKFGDAFFKSKVKPLVDKFYSKYDAYIDLETDRVVLDFYDETERQDFISKNLLKYFYTFDGYDEANEDGYDSEDDYEEEAKYPNVKSWQKKMIKSMSEKDTYDAYDRLRELKQRQYQMAKLKKDFIEDYKKEK